MLIQSRLQMILKMHNLTPSAFADEMGVQRSTVSHVLAGRNKPSLDFLEKIINHYPRVNAQWLLTGKMSANENTFQSDVKKTIEIKETETVMIEGVSLVKIIEFYSDNTIKEYFPRNK